MVGRPLLNVEPLSHGRTFGVACRLLLCARELYVCAGALLVVRLRAHPELVPVRL
jgi:hypothetical protein